MRRLFVLMLAGLLLLPQASAHAQAYPNRPIRWVLPFGPGSATDTLARIIGNDVAQAIGQPVVLLHKPGADGSLAAIETKRSAPDGYTFMFGTNSPFSVVQNIRKEPPYDTMVDFTPVTYLGDTPFVIVAHPSVPAKNLAELIAYAKANPKKLNYASGNTFAVVATAMFASRVGIEMQHIPYKTEPEAIPDVLSGQVQVMFATPTTSVPHIKAGKLTALAAIFDERTPLLPDVATMTEQGHPKLPIAPWFALAGPAGIPGDIVTVMNKAIATSLAKPEIRQQLAQFGFTPRPGTPEQLATYFKEQLAVWKAALKSAGIAPQ